MFDGRIKSKKMHKATPMGRDQSTRKARSPRSSTSPNQSAMPEV
jgi:hypothetical protein